MQTAFLFPTPKAVANSDEAGNVQLGKGHSCGSVVAKRSGGQGKTMGDAGGDDGSTWCIIMFGGNIQSNARFVRVRLEALAFQFNPKHN